jgi:transposase
VTSSYLEGDKNELGEYGYNRDKKKGKKQIVIGLLCDASGEPVSTEVFVGNTQDLATFSSQVHKASERFGCKRVTFVGDRGMIKSAQVKELSEMGFSYITSMCKSQIETLLMQDVIQLGLFDETLCEVEKEGVRYILRRNPIRVDEMAKSREKKMDHIRAFVEKLNVYLGEHPKANIEIAQRKVEEKILRLNAGKWLKAKVEERKLQLVMDDAAMLEVSRLDGCYVIKTDLPETALDAQSVHARYKDLAFVETAFRTCKTALLELRPVHVRKEASTRGHVVVVMLAYLVVRKLHEAWAKIDLTVEEGLEHLKTLCSLVLTVKESGASCIKIPEPREQSKQLLEALGLRFPPVIRHRNVAVVTRKKLTSRRK